MTASSGVPPKQGIYRPLSAQISGHFSESCIVQHCLTFTWYFYGIAMYVVEYEEVAAFTNIIGGCLSLTFEKYICIIIYASYTTVLYQFNIFVHPISTG